MFKKALLVIALFASVVNFSGCIFLVAGAAGAGTAKWLSDKVTQEVNSPVEKVTKATRAVLKDMDMEITKETQAPDVTQILAKNLKGDQIWVDLRPVSTNPNNTQIGVRVGYLNGEKDARKILENIVDKANAWL
jgi:hypothetical protein